jgi:hypothetical protein
MFLISTLRCFLLTYFIAFGMFSHHDYRTLFLFFCFFIFWKHTFSYNVFSKTHKNLLKKNLWFQILALERFSVSNPLGAFLLRPLLVFNLGKRKNNMDLTVKIIRVISFAHFFQMIFFLKTGCYFLFLSLISYVSFFKIQKRHDSLCIFLFYFVYGLSIQEEKTVLIQNFHFQPLYPNFINLGYYVLLNQLI